MVFVPVEFGCFDVAEPVRVAGGEEEDVGGDELVVLHPDDISHLKHKCEKQSVINLRLKGLK